MDDWVFDIRKHETAVFFYGMERHFIDLEGCRASMDGKKVGTTPWSALPSKELELYLINHYFPVVTMEPSEIYNVRNNCNDVWIFDLVSSNSNTRDKVNHLLFSSFITKRHAKPLF